MATYWTVPLVMMPSFFRDRPKSHKPWGFSPCGRAVIHDDTVSFAVCQSSRLAVTSRVRAERVKIFFMTAASLAPMASASVWMRLATSVMNS